MATRDEILDAALAVFAERGSVGATTRRIAEAAGVNEVTVFRHFGRKEGLLREALQQLSLGAAGSLPELPGNPNAELEEWATAYLGRLNARRAILRRSLGEVEQRRDIAAQLAAGRRAASTDLVRYLQALRPPASTTAIDIESVAALLVNALLGDALARDLTPEMGPARAQAARRYVEFILSLLGMEPAAAPARSASRPPYEPDATGA